MLKPLHNKKAIDKTVYNKLSPSGSRPGVMYGLPKVHKKCINGSPPFHPILSAIGTSTYNLAQFLQRRIQGDFDTGIPVWAPKLWRPKKGFLKFSRNS